MNQRDLFSAAVPIPGPVERAAYLEQAWGGDRSVTKEVGAKTREGHLARPA